jgi:hypothetical protein
MGLAALMEAPPTWFIHATLIGNQFIWSGMHVASHPALAFFPPHVFAAIRMRSAPPLGGCPAPHHRSRTDIATRYWQLRPPVRRRLRFSGKRAPCGVPLELAVYS